MLPPHSLPLILVCIVAAAIQGYFFYKAFGSGNAISQLHLWLVIFLSCFIPYRLNVYATIVITSQILPGNVSALLLCFVLLPIPCFAIVTLLRLTYFRLIKKVPANNLPYKKLVWGDVIAGVTYIVVFMTIFSNSHPFSSGGSR